MHSVNYKTDDNIEFLINKVLDVKPLVPYLSAYANSLNNNSIQISKLNIAFVYLVGLGISREYQLILSLGSYQDWIGQYFCSRLHP